MKTISFSMDQDTARRGTGFGEAGYNIVNSLQSLGWYVPYRDSSASLELSFAHPHNWKWSQPFNYRLGYFPWESTALKENWVKRMAAVDEVWVPTHWMTMFKELVDKPFYVYEHGIEKFWNQSKTKRERGEVLKFLHIGEPAPRKGGQVALDAFIAAFKGRRQDVHLTIKADGYNQALGPYNRHPYRVWENVSVITEHYSQDQMIQLLQDHDVLIYPSYGEGFGFIPLQAMANGMPTICTSAWASYAEHILPELRLSSTMIESPWDIHPGDIWEPSPEHLVEMLLSVEKRFDSLSTRAYAAADEIAAKYDWKTLTDQAFRRFETFSPVTPEMVD